VSAALTTTEDATAAEANRMAAEFEQVRALCYETNQGKGYAVRHGMKAATGEYIAFIDADTELDVTAITEYVERLIDTDADIVVGSKQHPDSDIAYTKLRTLLSKGYSFLIDVMFDLQVDDTQVGLKVLRREVVEAVAPEMVVNGYAFDIELLALANYLGFDIREAPIDLSLNGDSGIDWKSVLRIGYDTTRVFYRHRLTTGYDLDQGDR
jgi:glycosyltransferase involved in cell wall biosynthesis